MLNLGVVCLCAFVPLQVEAGCITENRCCGRMYAPPPHPQLQPRRLLAGLPSNEVSIDWPTTGSCCCLLTLRLFRSLNLSFLSTSIKESNKVSKRVQATDRKQSYSNFFYLHNPKPKSWNYFAGNRFVCVVVFLWVFC